jgi:hypothetical protein
LSVQNNEYCDKIREKLKKNVIRKNITIISDGKLKKGLVNPGRGSGSAYYVYNAVVVLKEEVTVGIINRDGRIIWEPSFDYYREVKFEVRKYIDGWLLFSSGITEKKFRIPPKLPPGVTILLPPPPDTPFSSNCVFIKNKSFSRVVPVMTH